MNDLDDFDDAEILLELNQEEWTALVKILEFTSETYKNISDKAIKENNIDLASEAAGIVKIVEHLVNKVHLSGAESAGPGSNTVH